MDLLFGTLIINEVFPNPSVGSEWVEILYLGENQPISNNYSGFSISDDKRVIYHFQGDEVWSGNLLLVELTGLNNDRDSVILKNAEEIIIDEMSYTSTKKDLSWLRSDPNQSLFVLGEPSPLQLNSIPEPSAKPTNNLQPTACPSPAAQTSTTTHPSPTITSQSPTTSSTKLPLASSPTNNKQETGKQVAINELLSVQDLSQKYFTNYQNSQNLQISYSKERQILQSRQVFLGQKILKKELINAIIGSALLLVAATLLSYEQRKKNQR